MSRSVLPSFTCCHSSLRFTGRNFRSFTTSQAFKMPEQLTKEEVEKGKDPSVSKQWDDETDVETKFKDFYSIADGLKVFMCSI